MSSTYFGGRVLAGCLAAAIAWPLLGFGQAPPKSSAAPPYPLPALVPAPARPAEQLIPISDQQIVLVSHKPRPTYATTRGKLLDGYYDIQRMQPVPGYDDGSMTRYLSSVGHLQQGMRQGEWKNHFLTKGEALDYKETYLDGLLHGPFVVYNPDKTIRYKTEFQYGSGVWKLFYPTGQVKQTGTYQRGREHGTWRWYAPTGQVARQVVY